MINIRYDLTSNLNMVSKKAWSPVWGLFAVGRVTAETTCPPPLWPLDTSSQVRANMLSPLRFEITDEILSNSTERQFWTISCCLMIRELNSIYRSVSLDGGKAVQGMWSDSNPVKLVPPCCRTCFEWSHREMSIAVRYMRKCDQTHNK